MPKDAKQVLNKRTQQPKQKIVKWNRKCNIKAVYNGPYKVLKLHNCHYISAEKKKSNAVTRILSNVTNIKKTLFYYMSHFYF